MEERKESTPSKKPTNSKKPQTGTYKKLNVVLAIVIIILFIIAAIRYEIIQFPDDSNGSNGNGNVQIILPLPTKGIINTHEHINDYYIMDEWLASQRQSNVSATIMVGSPNSTFWSKPKAPFITYLENNELIIKMAQDTNGEIIAFPTLDPKDDGNVERLKDYIKRGAVGLNLWTGHHGTLEFSWGNTTLYDWLGKLNGTDMDPVYEYCQENRIPIIWSNNLGVKEVREKLWPILERFPDMIIKIPHFGICFREYNLPIIESYLDNYTGLYTCFSWGHQDFVMEKFENISNGNRTEDILNFFYKYQDRILFGTDIVPTDNARKTIEWMRQHTQVYIDMLEKEKFKVEIYNFTPTGVDFVDELNGLNLPESILEKIYFKNTIKFLNGKRWNEELDDDENTRSNQDSDEDEKNYNYVYGTPKLILVTTMFVTSVVVPSIARKGNQMVK